MLAAIFFMLSYAVIGKIRLAAFVAFEFDLRLTYWILD
jgi:hypothetical protein